MTTAVLYRWRLKPGRADEFREAWAEGTRRIHTTCRSYGARLHEAEDGIIWSYALWPSELARQACMSSHDWFSQDCFVTMQDCIAERFEKIRLTVSEDALGGLVPRHDVPLLTTPRLVLRPMALDDIPSLAPALQDEANMRYWSCAPLATLDEVRNYLSWNIIAEAVQCFVIAETGAPAQALGWCVLMDRKPGTGEIGYMLRPDAQGRGLAREATARVLRHGFETRELRRIYADVDPENSGSIRLLEALGFELEGRLRGEWETHIGVRDSLIYGHLRP